MRSGLSGGVFECSPFFVDFFAVSNYKLRNPDKRGSFMPKLIIHSGTAQGHEFALKAGTNTLGRDDSNDFPIDDPSVSSFHAQIVVDSGSVLIKDLGSTNGTFILHSQVNEGVVQPGQFIRLGNVFLVLAADAPVPLGARSATPVVAPMAATSSAVQVRPAGPTSAPPVGSLNVTALGRAPAPAVRPMPEAPPPLVPVTASPAGATRTGTDFAEPPAGKTMCKHHHKTAGEWLCRKCNELFCTACVTTKKTSEGTNFFCRKCGGACVPVKVKFVAPKEKAQKKYSDTAILVRSLAFGFGGALLSALVWTGLSWLFGFDVPFIFCVLSAVICGFAVRFGSLNSPGAFFSVIAVVCCLLGSILGKVGMLVATHMTMLSPTYLGTSALGLLLSFVVAWKIGGSDT